MTASPRRIVLTGPECTGKTTLAALLAAELGVPLVGESARSYADEVGRALVAEDVEKIARRHIAAEDAVLATAPPTLVLDTDLVSTITYARHYYGRVAPWIVDEARSRRAPLYLLCIPDIPWTADGRRDRPAARYDMLGEFMKVLSELDALSAVVGGEGARRFESALKWVRLLATPQRAPQ